MSNDTLFENWKMVARLSQTVAAMKEELRKVYQMAGELSDVEPSLPNVLPALSAPPPGASATTDAPLVTHSSLAATDVKIKKKITVPAAKTAKAKTMAKTRGKTLTSPQAKSVETKPNPVSAATLPKNAATLLKHLGAVLNTKDFTAVNQTAVSKTTGIPVGSMTASLKRLMAAGHVQADSSGMFKLA